MKTDNKLANKLDKNLGQHFLKNVGVIEKIIDRISLLTPQKQVIEVGPGGGALTFKLLARGYSVLTIEVDARWIAKLEENCAEQLKAAQLRIVDGDATKIEPSVVRSLLNNPDKILLCGNLPYTLPPRTEPPTTK